MNAQPSRDDFNLDASRDPAGAYAQARAEELDGQKIAWDGLAAHVMHNLALMDEINAERARRKLPPLALPSATRKHSHYFKDVGHLSVVDVYRICDLFVDDRSGATQHAIKKLLMPGQRGSKPTEQDIKEARDTLNRKLEMLEEDKRKEAA